MIFYRRLPVGVGGDHELGEDSYREVMELIETWHVTKVPRDQLIYGALDGMASTLDRHSRGYTEEEWQEFQRSSQGDQAGIGIYFGFLKGFATVLHVFPDSPAERAGMKAGDRITTVNGQAIPQGVKTTYVRDLIMGPPGSQVDFKVRSLEDGQERALVVTRGIYHVTSVNSAVLGEKRDVGYIRLTSFKDHSDQEMASALKKLLKDGVSSLVLDLRDNPGGALRAAVGIVSQFLEADCVLRSSYRTHSQTYPSRGPLLAPDMPLVVLMNSNSASASEIVAGALQDYRRALIVGTPSYGKGVVQKIFPLETRPAGIKITTAFWLTPSGRVLQRGGQGDRDAVGGIRPDFLVEISRKDTQYLREFWQRLPLGENIVASLQQDENNLKLPEGYVDPQLGAALKLLRGEVVDVKVTP